MEDQKKIVVINGQVHKGSTWHIGNLLVQNLSDGYTVREYFLPRDLNHFCNGCFACLEGRDRCPYWADKEPVFRDMSEADLLILTSPNYCMMPSAPMKAFLDLFFTNWMIHKPVGEMFTKRAVVISSTAGAGASKTTGLIAENLKNWGVPEVMQYGIAVNAMNWEMVPDSKKAKIEKDTSKLARRLKSGRRRVRVGIGTRIRFWFSGMLQKANWGASESEKRYWEEQGWLSGKKSWNS